MHWSKVQLGFSSRNVHKFTARCSLNMVGEFLNPSDSLGHLWLFSSMGCLPVERQTDVV
jgi:hypothetical protein